MRYVLLSLFWRRRGTAPVTAILTANMAHLQIGKIEVLVCCNKLTVSFPINEKMKYTHSTHTPSYVIFYMSI